MKKKILSVILSFAAVLSMLTFPNASAKDGEYKTDIAITNALGFMQDMDTGNEDALVTRAEFAELTALVLGLDTSAAEDGWFEDVTKSHSHSGGIAAAARAGIIHGIEGKFYPDRSITYAEAATMLVNALGGKGFAEYEGAYNIGYLKLADNMGIKKNITAAAPGNNSEAAVTILEHIRI